MKYSKVSNERPATIGTKKIGKGISKVVSKVPLLFNVVIMDDAAMIPKIIIVKICERSWTTYLVLFGNKAWNSSTLRWPPLRAVYGEVTKIIQMRK